MNSRPFLQNPRLVQKRRCSGHRSRALGFNYTLHGCSGTRARRHVKSCNHVMWCPPKYLAMDIFSRITSGMTKLISDRWPDLRRDGSCGSLKRFSTRSGMTRSSLPCTHARPKHVVQMAGRNPEIASPVSPVSLLPSTKMFQSLDALSIRRKVKFGITIYFG